ncbi:hypothetical protein LAN30_26015, partial [Mycobacterium tuberculosis]|nr:hypothetical protein [Mycobacterium tuberculosis]
LPPVKAGIFQHAFDLAPLHAPRLLERVNAGDDLLMAFGQRLVRGWRRLKLRRFALQPAVKGLQQIARPFPDLLDHRRDIAGQG